MMTQRRNRASWLPTRTIVNRAASRDFLQLIQVPQILDYRMGMWSPHTRFQRIRLQMLLGTDALHCSWESEVARGHPSLSTLGRDAEEKFLQANTKKTASWQTLNPSRKILCCRGDLKSNDSSSH